MQPADVKAMDERDRYELYARLRALRAHWPHRFEMRFGAAGEAMLAALDPHVVDRDRYLKLRRIALGQWASGAPILVGEFSRGALPTAREQRLGE